MLFNSIKYAIFLPVVFACYWSISKNRSRNFFLLFASYYFYMSWNYKLVGLILATTIVSYICAIFIEKGKDAKTFLYIALVICLGVLGFFKYFNFMSTSVVILLNTFLLPVEGVFLKLMLPVGISFYTFQTLSYVVDVYKGKVKAEKDFFTYALYVSFFPQLVAGPIERTENLLPQFREKHIFDYELAVYGIKQIALGSFKKIVIADTLAQYVDKVYNDVYNYNGFVLVLATLFFTFQIYCDFSGYSDIALGSAKLLGFKLMTNFNTPYLSQDIREFWTRWHISLSTWFRDYVYIPLGGNRVSNIKQYRNIMITFILSGLWHGANWTFVLWGAYHGFLNILQSIFSYEKKPPFLIRVLITFCFVNVGWVIFRANNLSELKYILSTFLYGVFTPLNYIYNGFAVLGLTNLTSLLKFIPIIVFLIIEIIAYKCDVINSTQKLFAPFRYAVYLILSYVTILWYFYYLINGVTQAFIYFQF